MIDTQVLPRRTGSPSSWERFEALYRCSRDDVYAYVASLLGDRTAAEDVTSLAFERAYRRRITFDRRRGEERAWLFGIARNAALDELRRRKRVVALAAEPEDVNVPGAEDGAEVALRRTTVREALAGLPAREREVIALKFHGGLRNAELALILSADRPRSSEEFARALDDRVARRFARRPRRGKRPDAGPRQGRWWRWRSAPAAAAATFAIAVLAVVVGLSSSGIFSTGPRASHRTITPLLAPIPASKRAPNVGASSSGAGAPPSLPSPGKRQVVQSAQLQLMTAPAGIEDVAQQVFDVIGDEKGVVSSSSVTASGNSNGSADFQLTVPNANLSATMTALSALRGARVVSRSDASSDITGKVGGAGERLADARAVRRSLLRQLGTATTAQQIASLKLQLRDADASISSDLSTLRGLHGQVDNSNISLTIGAVPPAAKRSAGATFTIGRALHSAARVLVVTAGVALIVLAALVPLALIAALLAWIGSAVRRRRREQALDLP